MLDFPIGVQTSRLRFDDRWTLGAKKIRSGNPPAIRAGHKWMRTAKAGIFMEGFSLHILFIRQKTRNFYTFSSKLKINTCNLSANQL